MKARACERVGHAAEHHVVGRDLPPLEHETTREASCDDAAGGGIREMGQGLAHGVEGAAVEQGDLVDVEDDGIGVRGRRPR